MVHQILSFAASEDKRTPFARRDYSRAEMYLYHLRSPPNKSDELGSLFYEPPPVGKAPT